MISKTTEKVLKRLKFKKKWLSDKSSYWYQKKIKTILGTFIFNCEEFRDKEIFYMEAKGRLYYNSTKKDTITMLKFKGLKEFLITLSEVDRLKI